MLKKITIPLLFSIFILLLVACESDVPVPKPRTYPRVEYPLKRYKTFTEGYCGFSFEYPEYANIVQDTEFFGEAPPSPCWFTLETPSLNASIHCSYLPIKNRQSLDKYVADAYQLTNEHTAKANYIDEFEINRPDAKVHGVLFSLEGPVASTIQFFATDSTHHFFRGSLYFQSRTQPDSLAPVVAFFKEDVKRMVETLKWEK